MQNLASQLMPYFNYILYAQFVLLCCAVLFGCIVILRRILGRSQLEGDPYFDSVKVAEELETEMKRLDDLRRRLQPGAAAFDRTEASGGPDVAPSAADRELVQRVFELEQEVQKKTRELEKLAAGAPAGGVTPEQLVEARQKAIEEYIAKHPAPVAPAGGGPEVAEMTTKVAHLEKVVSEYQIFEEDLALVKRFKVENEELKRKIEMMTTTSASATAPTVAPSVQAVTEADIASMFKELSRDEPPSEKIIAADAPAPVETQIFAATAPELEPAPILALAPEPKPAEIAAAAPVKMPEPANPSSADELDAVAESAASSDDDKLMAEFEKLLESGTKGG